MWYIHTMEYSSAIRRNGCLLHVIWVSLKNIMLSERSQHWKTHIIPFMSNIQRRKMYRDRKYIMIVWSRDWDRNIDAASEDKVSR